MKTDKQNKENIEYNGKELALFISNDFALYDQQMLPIIRGSVKNYNKNTFRQDRFDVQLRELIRNGAKKYTLQFGGEKFCKKSKAIASQILREQIVEAINYELK